MLIRVGIIGFGRIGNEHAGWLAQCSNAKATVVFDPTPARRALAESRGLKVLDSADAVYRSDQVDAILIATPTARHFEDAQSALANRRHVMIEKPMAMNLQQCELLQAASINCGKVLSVFHNRRWDIDYLTVKSAIDSGLFGKMINIESRLGQWSSCVGPAAKEYRPNWRNEGAFGGGGLFDWGSHFIDQIWPLMLPAKPIRVFAQLRGNVWTSDCDDFARICINFDNGAVAMVEINTTTTRPLPRWHIDGTTGSADSPFSLSFNTHEWARLTFSPSNGSAAVSIAKAAVGLNETQIWDTFAAACIGKGEPAVKVQSVLTTMKLMDAARQSSLEGAAVSV